MEFRKAKPPKIVLPEWAIRMQVMDTKLKAIKELTEPLIERSGRFWKVKIHLHPKHQDYISTIMEILEGSYFKEKSE